MQLTEPAKAGMKFLVKESPIVEDQLEEVGATNACIGLVGEVVNSDILEGTPKQVELYFDKLQETWWIPYDNQVIEPVK